MLMHMHNIMHIKVKTFEKAMVTTLYNSGEQKSIRMHNVSNLETAKLQQQLVPLLSLKNTNLRLPCALDN